MRRQNCVKRRVSRSSCPKAFTTHTPLSDSCITEVMSAVAWCPSRLIRRMRRPMRTIGTTHTGTRQRLHSAIFHCVYRRNPMIASAVTGWRTRSVRIDATLVCSDAVSVTVRDIISPVFVPW